MFEKASFEKDLRALKAFLTWFYRAMNRPAESETPLNKFMEGIRPPRNKFMEGIRPLGINSRKVLDSSE
jgi:hypothetical protein